MVLTGINKIVNGTMDGSVFRLFFSWVMRLYSYLVLPAACYASYLVWRSMIIRYDVFDRSSVSVAIDIALTILLQVVILIAAYFLFYIWKTRSKSIQLLHKDPDFFATPVLMILIKTCGEVIAVSWIFVNVWSIILAGIISPLHRSPYTDGLGYDFSAQLIPIQTSVLSPIHSFVFLLLTYFVTEMLGSLPSIAYSARKSTNEGAN